MFVVGGRILHYARYYTRTWNATARIQNWHNACTRTGLLVPAQQLVTLRPLPYTPLLVGLLLAPGAATTRPAITRTRGGTTRASTATSGTSSVAPLTRSCTTRLFPCPLPPPSFPKSFFPAAVNGKV